MIAPTVHYHHNTVVFPSNYEGNTSAVYGNDSLNADALLRTYGSPQGSNSIRQTRVDRVVMQDTSISRPNAGEVRAVYHRTRFRNNLPSSTIVDSELIHQRREENSVHTNTTAYESLLSYESYGDPSLELSLTTNSSEDRSQEEQH
ncbi:uncharacterized protein LOC130991919 [Salvia miltiorrhiza]|uniref:uncharacterized protein LOC130991919 n=1 Tax=Salvia miltiorrhiza TaxID=226208 RepID=UPI0025AD6E06|nr:uncharacterized protein LOC130991919 [Salvia miltiorrhiza]